jgi:cell pole-organizing protein PopZ
MPDNAKSPLEPSMEEIIASISRIITDDKRAAGPAFRVSGEKSGILELTEVVDEDGSVRRVTPPADNPNAPSAAPAAAVDPSVATATARSEAGPSDPEAGSEPKPELGRDRILSSATSEAAAAAFARLGSLPRERRREGELPLGSADRTLEDMVRNMLRPMLQTWLDEHLPGIVERLVREEIARVVGDAGLR